MLWIGILIVINTSDMSSSSSLMFANNHESNTETTCKKSLQNKIEELSKKDTDKIYKIVGRCDPVQWKTIGDILTPD